MELLGRIFGRHAPQETEPKPPSPELIGLMERWNDQLRNRRATETAIATEELLQALANNLELIPFNSLKFVRDGNRVVMNFGGTAHYDIAKAGGLQHVDDAGKVGRDSKQENTLIVSGDSLSLHVRPNKKNRLETVRILRKMAPGIKID